MQENGLEALTAQICTAYLGNNQLPIEQVPDLIRNVHQALMGLNSAQSDRPTPAVPIEESVTPEYLVCLEDGEKVVLLKRYLKDHHNMTPEEYKEKWGLPEDYPLVARSYSERRSAIAKESGLGKS